MSSYVIGDIHGCLDELRYLFASLPLATQDSLIFLGDYIDRGPDSKGVVSYLVELRSQIDKVNLVFLKGNHEDMLLSYLGHKGQHGEMFLVNGGKATVASYGLASDRVTPDALAGSIPPEHLNFYLALDRYYLTQSFLCVHAGIDPDKSLEEQTDEELFWIRNKFIYRSHGLPYTVIFGHTPQQSVLYDLPHKVGLDTGLVYGNLLTCLDVDEKVLYQIGRGKKRVMKVSIANKWNFSQALFR